MARFKFRLKVIEKMKKLIFPVVLGIAAFATSNLQAQTQQVRVTVSSNAPTGGVALTPLWAGFHDGSFDSYNGGLSAQEGIERIAEDGDASRLISDFNAGYSYIDNSSGTATSALYLTSQTSGRVDGLIGSVTGPPPIQPGESASAVFNLTSGQNDFFSYASMILPSNDALVFNGGPTAHNISSLFSGGAPISFVIGQAGTVNDVGTEVNDFADVADPLGLVGGGQSGPNQGADEFGVVTNITGDYFSTFANQPVGEDLSLLNFNNYSNGVATVTIEAIPEPSSAVVLGLGLTGLFARRRRTLN